MVAVCSANICRWRRDLTGCNPDWYSVKRVANWLISNSVPRLRVTDLGVVLGESQDTQRYEDHGHSDGEETLAVR
jgi:hypothetical protein